MVTLEPCSDGGVDCPLEGGAEEAMAVRVSLTGSANTWVEFDAPGRDPRYQWVI